MSGEKRRQRRDYCPSEVSFVEWDNGSRFKVETARCCNIGPTGMCIFVSSGLEPGAILKISKPHGKRPSEVATVRWIEKLDWNLFRAGLAFL